MHHIATCSGPGGVRLILLIMLLAAGEGRAQPRSIARGDELVPASGIQRNAVSVLHAEGDSLWVGPLLNLTVDGGRTWQIVQADSLARSTVYSVDAEGEVVWAGLGETRSDVGGPVPEAGGFLYSEDGGHTFTYRFPQLDVPGDTLVTYGISTLRAVDVVVPDQSPPLDIDYDPARGDVWVAGWMSGIRRSSDAGRHWARVVLPPDSLDEIRPDRSYSFRIDPRGGAGGSYNHVGFSVLVDEAGTVWAGTLGGVNRSRDGGQSWRRFRYDGSEQSLTGSWVVDIEEQPLPGPNPIWMATWRASASGEMSQNGITVTRDGGETFEQVLTGSYIIDFAFRGDTVYAAGLADGLFVSDDGGQAWQVIRDFPMPQQPDAVLRPDAEILSVAATDEALWVGTDDGLLKSTDGGRSWRLFRAEVPLHPEVPTEQVPRVDTYAYPNPFSPGSDRLVRIRYELAQPAAVEVRIFDFGMNPVRRLDVAPQEGGIREVAWDGMDDRGLRVANGPYFYAVRTGGETYWGKILVLE